MDVVDTVLSPVEKILSCGNQSDALAARDRELEEARAQAEEFRSQAEAYKRQLDEAMAEGGNGILKNQSGKNGTAFMNGRSEQSSVEKSRNASRNASFRSTTSNSNNGRKIAFTDEQMNGGRPISEKKNLRVNPSLFSYNPSGRI